MTEEAVTKMEEHAKTWGFRTARVLEERKRLLKAARLGVEGLRVALSDCASRQSVEWQAKLDSAQDAIAFAEEAAP